MSRVTLYDAETGNSCLVDAGDGTGASREKSWLEEIPRWLKEAVEPGPGAAFINLKGLGKGILANYPTHLDGSKRESNAIGGSAPIQPFSGADWFEVVNNTSQIGTGDAAETDFGQEVLTQGDPSADDYANTGSDGLAVPVPQGAQTPAFVLSSAGNFNLSATDGLLTIIVNGASFTVNVGVGAATTPEAVVAAIVAAGVPVAAYVNDPGVGDEVLLLTLGVGASQTIQVSRPAGSAGATIFPAAAATARTGNGGPLNDNRASSTGLKSQRRVLPTSVVVTTTIASATVTLTDDGAGVLDDGTGTHTGTIDYVTGAVNIDYGTAPDNGAAVTASYKVLSPLNLTDPVRVPRTGKEVAVLINT